MPAQQFSGFPEETLRFLAQLSANNNRDWFNDHKQAYSDYIIAPSVAFVESMGQRLQLIAPGIQYDTRTNGAGSMTRIYRDTRFSEDKTPYKTWIGIIFWEGTGKRTENPGYYFGFDPSGAGIHTGMHGFTKPQLEAYRAAVVEDGPGQELETILEAIRGSGGYEIGGQHYKRVPRGFDQDHQRAHLLLHNGLYASSPGITSAQFTSPDLLDICMSHFENTAPLHRWLVSVMQAANP